MVLLVWIFLTKKDFRRGRAAARSGPAALGCSGGHSRGQGHPGTGPVAAAVRSGGGARPGPGIGFAEGSDLVFPSAGRGSRAIRRG